MHYLFSIYFNN